MTKPTEHDALLEQERRIFAARMTGADFLREVDDLAPARGVVWLLAAYICLIAFFILVLAWPLAADAQLRGVVNIAAWHSRDTTTCERPVITAPASDRPMAPMVTSGGSAEQALDTWTPGLGAGYDLTADSMVSGGLWRNSQGTVAPYATIDWRPLHLGPVSLGLFGGLSAGYCGSNNGGPTPLAGATARIDLDRVAVHLLLAKKPGDNSTAVGLAISVAIL
jgi:hypothetical protein